MSGPQAGIDGSAPNDDVDATERQIRHAEVMTMSLTEITLAGGDRLRVHGDPREVEKTILAAARGSIMELAWLTEADSGHSVGVNPDYVVTVRAATG